MYNRSFVKIGGLFTILTGLCFLGTSLTLPLGASRVIYAWLGLAGSVLLVPAMWGMYQFLNNEKNSSSLQLGVIAMLTGVPFLIGIYLLAYVAAVSTGSALWDAATANATPATLPLLEMYEDVLLVSALVTILIGSFLTFGAAPFFISYASLRTTEVPKWLAWVGIIAGVYSFLWLGWGWAIQPAQILILLPGILLNFIWILAMGIYMLRFRESGN
jgi:hypothetical protein